MYLVTASEMQAMDRQTIDSFGLPGRILMENAGRGAARVLLASFEGLGSRKIGILAGRGNNGGDGFVVARSLAHRGLDVRVYLLGTEAQVRAGDAADNLKLLHPSGVPVIEIPQPDAFAARQKELEAVDLWVDAVLGIGLKSNVTGYFAQIIQFVNRSGKPVLALDVPSGLNADTGHPCGECVRAHSTATFAFAKTGLLVYPGAAYAGKLHVVDIGVPPHIVEAVNPRQRLLTPAYLRTLLRPRRPEAHKGSTGHLLVLAGSPGKTGAAAMAGIAALRTGAGLATLLVPRSLNGVFETLALETMSVPLPETPQGTLAESALETICDHLPGKKGLIIGPGLGTAAETGRLVHRLVQECKFPLVIDADGLNNLAGATAVLRRLHTPAILTPHPGEMARLTAKTVDEIQRDRIKCTREFAEAFNVHVVLKGARTIVAHPDGRVFINPTGNPGMASGGMGDVLAGIIGGWIAQGLPAEAAAHLGVYLHGAAADTLSKTRGPVGFLASDLLACLPGEISTLGGLVSQPPLCLQAVDG